MRQPLQTILYAIAAVFVAAAVLRLAWLLVAPVLAPLAIALVVVVGVVVALRLLWYYTSL